MEEKTAKLPNEALVPELKKVTQDIDRCIQKTQLQHVAMHDRFGTFELGIGIAKLQEAQLWLEQVIFRLGYKH
jgi:hypothetical protein